MSLSNARQLSRSDGELNYKGELNNDGGYKVSNEEEKQIKKLERSKKRKDSRSQAPAISTLLARRKRRKDIVSIKRLPFEIEEIKVKNALMLRRSLRTFDSKRVFEIVSGGLININAVDQVGVTALHEAAIDGNLVCVNLLVSYGAHINEKDIEGYTPLDYAVFAGNFECASFLIEKGARDDGIRDGQIVCNQNRLRSMTFC